MLSQETASVLGNSYRIYSLEPGDCQCPREQLQDLQPQIYPVYPFDMPTWSCKVLTKSLFEGEIVHLAARSNASRSSPPVPAADQSENVPDHALGPCYSAPRVASDGRGAAEPGNERKWRQRKEERLNGKSGTKAL